MCFIQGWKCKVKVLVAQACPTLCDPMDCSLPGSSVHGILQARRLEWVAIPFTRGFSQPRDWTQVSWVAGSFFTVWVQQILTGKLKLSLAWWRLREIPLKRVSANSVDSGITEGLVRMQILSLEGWGGAQASAFLMSSQFRVRLLIQASHWSQYPR